MGERNLSDMTKRVMQAIGRLDDLASDLEQEVFSGVEPEGPAVEAFITKLNELEQAHAGVYPKSGV